MPTKAAVCRRLAIEDFRWVEIESKRRVVPEDQADLRRHLETRKGVRHLKRTLFFDQFLDTPQMDLFRLGASLRLRYKRNGSRVYMQYKGPGFHSAGLLYRSELSTARITDAVMEESHHDIVHFTDTSVQDILERHVDYSMRRVMERHLGKKVMARIAAGPIISIYEKDKFHVDLGDDVFLEPSLDRIFAFHISKAGLHPLSTFCEYENEIKAPWDEPDAKIEHLDELLEFDARLSKSFDLPAEPLDKYHRCSSFFMPLAKKNGHGR